MFKTSEQCSIELVAHTMLADDALPDNAIDLMPCSAARVSFGNEDKTGQDLDKDRKLMKYLADHKHMTPFEYQHATFMIECPLFIRSQIHRHRTFSFNEISRRYTDENLEFWVPDQFRGQHKTSKQASSNDVIEFITGDSGVGEWRQHAGSFYEQAIHEAFFAYTQMINSGVAREQARSVLPQSLLTKFYMGGSLRNWAHFIELRRDAHAQKEVQIVAEKVAAKLRGLWPESCNALGI